MHNSVQYIYLFMWRIVWW